MNLTFFLFQQSMENTVKSKADFSVCVLITWQRSYLTYSAFSRLFFELTTKNEMAPKATLIFATKRQTVFI